MFKIFNFMKNDEKQEMIQEELNLDNIDQKQDDVDVTESLPEGSILAHMEELRVLINQSVMEAFKPFEMLLAEMKQITDEVEDTKEELVEAKEEISEKIDTAETVIQQTIIEKLADRGIDQINDNNADTSFLSARDKLRMEYRNNPSKFLNTIK